jgi:DnaJ-class molecular chaperone
VTTSVVFGQTVPCPTCHGLTRVRGSGLDDRQRAELRRRGEKVPAMHTCDTCGGRGLVDRAVADGTAPATWSDR